MKKKMILILSVITMINLVSCGTSKESSNSSIQENKTYTVTWKNDNGDVLEVDNNVNAGSMPSYDGSTPSKEGNDQYSYTFSGWDSEIKEVDSDITYTATYTTNIKTYTITWENYDGSTLETDEVPYGSVPSYDGSTPTKEGNEDVIYVFNGWSPTITEVTKNETYVATFKEVSNNEMPGLFPVIDTNSNTVKYGFYPQTHVNNETLISELNSLESSSSNGWYLYNNEYYVKEKANVFNNESYTFNDGTEIINGNEYWFKCEPIRWNILDNGDGNYYLLSSMLLDAQYYYKDYSDRLIDKETIYANNYANSDIRAWLNNDFYLTAFNLNNSFIKEVNVNNSTSTTDNQNNKYACENTNDKVYLPSYQDYLNLSYGFDNDASKTSSTRECKTTDYLRIRGAWCNVKVDVYSSSKYNGSYWTRSPSSEYNYCAWNVNSAGYLSEYAVDGLSHSVRPCITISYN